jgi:hypothetical protein
MAKAEFFFSLSTGRRCEERRSYAEREKTNISSHAGHLRGVSSNNHDRELTYHGSHVGAPSSPYHLNVTT